MLGKIRAEVAIITVAISNLISATSELAEESGGTALETSDFPTAVQSMTARNTTSMGLAPSNYSTYRDVAGALSSPPRAASLTPEPVTSVPEPVTEPRPRRRRVAPPFHVRYVMPDPNMTPSDLASRYRQPFTGRIACLEDSIPVNQRGRGRRPLFQIYEDAVSQRVSSFLGRMAQRRYIENMVENVTPAAQLHDNGFDQPYAPWQALLTREERHRHALTDITISSENLERLHETADTIAATREPGDDMWYPYEE